MKILRLFLICFFLASCSNIEFVHKNKEGDDNELYNKTVYNIKGDTIPEIGTNILRLLGKSDEGSYFLEININEEIIKRSVEKNQVSKKTDYEISMNYKLTIKNSLCDLYVKNISSRFSFVTKSSGYNFGSDESLSKLYDMAVAENLNRFVGSANEYLKINKCLNEN